jgi:trigger factor
MQVTIENTAPCRKTLRVEVPTTRVEGLRAEVLREFKKEARLPGFRPGKAPEPMVEKRYAKEIDEELQRRLVPETYREALAEQKLRVIGYPRVSAVECQRGKPLTFTAEVDVAPEFALPEYKGLPVKKHEHPVAEDEVTKTLDGLRDQQADFVDVTGRSLQTNDFAVLDYSGVCDGKPISEIAPEAKALGENKAFWLLVTADSFLPGFCEQLLGAQPAEKRQVLVDFPADFPQKPLAGKKATFFVTVTGIKEKKLPEANDDFAKKVGVDSVAKLQEEIRKQLAAERAAEADGEVRRQIVDQLLAKASFELPESLVAQETKSIIYDVVRENSMRGVTKQQLEARKDELFGQATASARDRVRMSFVLDAIAEKEGIKVEETEVNQRIVLMAQRYRTTPERLRAQLTEKDGLGELEEQVRTTKTLDFLVANAKVEAVKE